MIRRLLLTYLSLTLVVLGGLALPLGLVYERGEQQHAAAQLEHDAEVLAAFVDTAQAKGQQDQVDALARQFGQRWNARVEIVDHTTAPPDLAAIISGQAQVINQASGGHMAVAVPIHPGNPDQGAVRVTVPTGPLEGRIHQFWTLLAVVGVIVLGGGALIAVALARWIGRPVRALERATRSLAEAGHLGGSTRPGPAAPITAGPSRGGSAAAGTPAARASRADPNSTRPSQTGSTATGPARIDPAATSANTAWPARIGGATAGGPSLAGAIHGGPSRGGVSSGGAGGGSPRADLIVAASTTSWPPELRRLAATFNTTAARLQELIAAQRSFIGHASHQLKTPLAAMRLRLENLEPDIAPGGEANLRAALVETDRLATMVDTLLAMTQGSRAAETVSLGPAAEERAALWRPMAAERGVTVTISGPEGSRVRAISGSIEQILDNLLSNALAVAPSGSTVAVTWQPVSAAVELHVVDAGPGLTGEQRGLALEPFWRAPGAPKGGTGLGLALVQKLAEAAGGAARLDAAAPTGLDAVVSLPRA